MDKLVWCLRKSDGLCLIEPNSNLADAYVKKAEDALASMRINTIRDWKISTAYYTLYFSLYAVLMRVGVKCEIHSCTIEFARRLLQDYFSEEEADFLGKSLQARIDSQYYVNKAVPDKQYNDMIEKAPEFFVKCKSVLLQLNEKTILGIRERFKAASQ
jgi:uncharacterized protein (UPF0332 family)